MGAPNATESIPAVRTLEVGNSLSPPLPPPPMPPPPPPPRLLFVVFLAPLLPRHRPALAPAMCAHCSTQFRTTPPNVIPRELACCGRISCVIWDRVAAGGMR